MQARLFRHNDYPNSKPKLFLNSGAKVQKKNDISKFLRLEMSLKWMRKEILLLFTQFVFLLVFRCK